MVYVTRHMHFNAAHRLHSDVLSDPENEQLYGVCNNPMGHGHNYELEITIKGEPDPVTGMVIDLKELKDIVQQVIIDRVDHKHLNFDVDFMRGIVPTAENIVVAFWQQLKDKIPQGELYELKLYETPRNMATFRGE
ncbi:6-carboxytetrahydropterin synthase [candidate division KSB1 bacterium]|nr:6-carboxytetrahydropterin synthase [candidate division KSB1 bacterium]